MRINARFDDEAERQINYLTEATGFSISHVVREAVSRYYHEVRAERAGLRHFAAMIGKGRSGRSDVAGHFKQYVADAIQAKYAPRPK